MLLVSILLTFSTTKFSIPTNKGRDTKLCTAYDTYLGTYSILLSLSLPSPPLTPCNDVFWLLNISECRWPVSCERLVQFEVGFLLSFLKLFTHLAYVELHPDLTWHFIRRREPYNIRVGWAVELPRHISIFAHYPSLQMFFPIIDDLPPRFRFR